MELVVLVDAQNNPIGTADKNTVHTTQTPLHRAFSLFLFNSQKELLVTQRAPTKKTFPGIWSNTVCGHPAPNESTQAAVIRRAHTELGVEVESVQLVSNYAYRFTDQSGIVENEICPIFIGFSDTPPNPDPLEISAWKWVPWQTFLKEIIQQSHLYSPWCREEALLVDQFLQNQ